jgi:dihydrofolate reductase (trimethoprim resistance protein)
MFTLEEVIGFLSGTEPLDGVWFGEDHPSERGKYWWRKYLRAATSVADQDNIKPVGKFQLGDVVRKKSGSMWEGTVVGTYSTTLTPEGYAVESSTHHGSVQIYPAAALELIS